MFYKKAFLKIHRKILVLESLSITVKGFKTIRLPTLLKQTPALVFRPGRSLVLFKITHPALRRRSDVAVTSLCTSQWRRRYVSNETPNDISMEHRQDVSVTRLCDVLWNVITTSQKDVTTTPHFYVTTTSQTSLKWNTQRRLDGTLPKRVSGTYPWRPISTSLRHLL